MRQQIRLAAIAAFLLAVSGLANAASYPVSGRFTYDNPDAEGAAKECGLRFMEFKGEERRDTGGGVPGYRNFSVAREGDRYRIVDQFATGQINARVNYTLREVDENRIEIVQSGKTVRLRRCG